MRNSDVHATLEEHNESPYDRFFYFNPTLQRVVHQHITAADFRMLPESHLNYHTAVFTRNPYDRAYSAFLQVQRDFKNLPSLRFPSEWIGDLVRQQLTDNMRLVISARYDFDRWIELLPEHEVREIGRNTCMSLHPMHYWTHVNGSQVASFIGRVETFDEDFASLCELVELERPDLVLSNITDAENLVGGYRYVSQMSQQSRSIINSLFEDDFQILGYQMV